MSQPSEQPSSPPTPLTPLTPGFEALCFTVDAKGEQHHPLEDVFDKSCVRSDSFHFEPIIRKVNKCGNYALNNDAFEEVSRSVSVASLHELSDISPVTASEEKEKKFNSIHKPVLYLKSCPSPSTTFKNKLSIDPDCLLNKLSLLDNIISDMSDTNDETPNSPRLHSEKCKTLEAAFEDIETEIHCNPAYSQPGDKGPGIQAGKKRQKKKRQKVSQTEGSASGSDN